MEILIIEDRPEEQEEVERIVREAGHLPLVVDNLVKAYPFLPRPSSPEESGHRHPENKVDGILTDLHFPYGEGKYNLPDQPCGLAVAARCGAYGLPFVICTDCDHHGPKVEWINGLARAMGWHMVTGVAPDPADEGKKNWRKALSMLLSNIAEANQDK